jgi:hypothetical protein
MRLDKEEEIDYIRQQMEGNGVKWEIQL